MPTILLCLHFADAPFDPISIPLTSVLAFVPYPEGKRNEHGANSYVRLLNDDVIAVRESYEDVLSQARGGV